MSATIRHDPEKKYVVVNFDNSNLDFMFFDDGYDDLMDDVDMELMELYEDDFDMTTESRNRMIQTDETIKDFIGNCALQKIAPDPYTKVNLSFGRNVSRTLSQVVDEDLELKAIEMEGGSRKQFAAVAITSPGHAISFLFQCETSNELECDEKRLEAMKVEIRRLGVRLSGDKVISYKFECPGTLEDCKKGQVRNLMGEVKKLKETKDLIEEQNEKFKAQKHKLLEEAKKIKEEKDSASKTRRIGERVGLIKRIKANMEQNDAKILKLKQQSKPFLDYIKLIHLSNPKED